MKGQQAFPTIWDSSWFSMTMSTTRARDGVGTTLGGASVVAGGAEPGAEALGDGPAVGPPTRPLHEAATATASVANEARAAVPIHPPGRPDARARGMRRGYESRESEIPALVTPRSCPGIA